jgi:hypothetical protein
VILILLIPAALLFGAWSLRQALDGTLWHESDLFVTKDSLLDFKDMTATKLNQ